ncbi:MAG: DUF4139 domain-containing protein [Proteobacteria bacterium]|nr:DUF4139 domain-containing protein [Pseudomonadota bacterium]
MPRRLLVTALAFALSATAACAAGDSSQPSSGIGNAALTIYHASDDSLFSGDASGSVDSGYGVVHETRKIDLQGGRQTLRIGGLPASVDPEAVMLGFPGNAGVKILGRRIVLSRGNADSALAGHVGEQVVVAGSNGQALASGTLLGVDGDGLTVRKGDGGVIVVHDYATVALQPGSIGGGGSLILALDSSSAGARDARLSYTTSGLGWRAAYAVTLAGGSQCRMHFDPQASIANRSGRDYDHAGVKLVAGQPNLSQPPRMFMAKAAMAAEAAPPMPQQRTLGDYRSFTLPDAIDLPDGTVTLAPLYAASDLDCTRQYLLEAGGGWQPPKPMLDGNFNNDAYQDRPIAATLGFTAPDALPAGMLRASMLDQDGASELLGQGDIPDTPKGKSVSVTLGESFDLRASRERTAFTADKASRTMDEAFRITLSNGGDAARTVTVREHPNRWKVWKLLSSSVKPDKQTPDMLEFSVAVPAHGKTVLDYRVQYAWLPKDE